MRRLKFFRTSSAEVTVPASRIVEPIDVIRDIESRRLASCVDSFLDPFLLEAAEEGLDDCVILAIAPAAHARLQVIGFPEPAPGVAAVLRALI